MSISFNNAQFQKQIEDVMKKCIKAGKDVPTKGAEIIDTVTDKLLEESVKRSPVDEGFLEGSHEKTVKKSRILSNIEGHVFIPTNSPASDYAMYMHEAQYNLGERSKRKQATLTVVVGRKFMERAFDENVRAFNLFIIKQFKEFFRNGK